MNQFYIKIIGKEEIPETQDFLFKMVKILFDMDRDPQYHNDIINMGEVYIDNERNALIGAYDGDGHLVGSIAIKQFVDRFESIKGRYNEERTAELGRCYISKELRRQGIGSLLLDKIVGFARESGYERIYLHTHRHLPGGFDFWIKKGFVITKEDQDSQKTVHMEKLISLE